MSAWACPALAHVWLRSKFRSYRVDVLVRLDVFAFATKYTEDEGKGRGVILGDKASPNSHIISCG